MFLKPQNDQSMYFQVIYEIQKKHDKQNINEICLC